MGDYLRSLDRYENIHLYPQVIHAVLDELIDKCKGLFGYSPWKEHYQLSSRFKALGQASSGF